MRASLSVKNTCKFNLWSKLGWWSGPCSAMMGLVSLSIAGGVLMGGGGLAFADEDVGGAKQGQEQEQEQGAVVIGAGQVSEGDGVAPDVDGVAGVASSSDSVSLGGTASKAIENNQAVDDLGQVEALEALEAMEDGPAPIEAGAGFQEVPAEGQIMPLAGSYQEMTGLGGDVGDETASAGETRDSFFSIGRRDFPMPISEMGLLKAFDDRVDTLELDVGYELFNDLLLVGGFRSYIAGGDGEGWDAVLNTYNFSLGARFQKYLYKDVLLAFIKGGAGLMVGSLEIDDYYAGRGSDDGAGPDVSQDTAAAAAFDMGAGVEFLIPHSFWGASETSFMRNFTAGLVLDFARVIAFPLEFDQVVPTWETENGESAPLNMGKFELSGWTTHVGLVIHF